MARGKSETGTSRKQSRNSGSKSSGSSRRSSSRSSRSSSNGKAARKNVPDFSVADPKDIEEAIDVFVDAPVVKVDEIEFELDDLRAHLALLAEVGHFVQLNAGAAVRLGKVELNIQGVEAQAMLEVRLQEVTKILARVLTTLDRNPELLKSVGDALGDVGDGAHGLLTDAGDVVRSAGRGAGSAVQDIGSGAERGVAGIGQGAQHGVQGLGQGARQGVEGLGAGAQPGVEGLGQGAQQGVQGVGEGAAQGVEGLAQGGQSGGGQTRGG